MAVDVVVRKHAAPDDIVYSSNNDNASRIDRKQIDSAYVSVLGKELAACDYHYYAQP